MTKYIESALSPFWNRTSPAFALRLVVNALGRFADLTHEPNHLPQAEDVERQQSQMKHEKRIGGAEIAIGDEEHIAADAHDPKRDHGFHRECQEDQTGGDVTQDVGEAHFCFFPVSHRARR
jgi:hypothetical protein